MTLVIKGRPTRVVNYRYHKCEVLITRPGIWGNPFLIGRDGTREEVVAKYEQYLRGNAKLLSLLPQIRGKVLGCVCKTLTGTPVIACHGDVIARLADEGVDGIVPAESGDEGQKQGEASGDAEQG